MSKLKRPKFHPARKRMAHSLNRQRGVVEADTRGGAEELERRAKAADFGAFDRIMDRETREPDLGADRLD